jgi:hypothetical protein
MDAAHALCRATTHARSGAGVLTVFTRVPSRSTSSLWGFCSIGLGGQNVAKKGMTYVGTQPPGLSDVSDLAAAVAFLERVLSMHETASCHFDLGSFEVGFLKLAAAWTARRLMARLEKGWHAAMRAANRHAPFLRRQLSHFWSFGASRGRCWIYCPSCKVRTPGIIRECESYLQSRRA